MMKLLGNTENKITKNENRKDIPNLEIVEVVLVHCNVCNNDYQQNSRVLCTFVSNNFFGQLLVISPKKVILPGKCNIKSDALFSLT